MINVWGWDSTIECRGCKKSVNDYCFRCRRCWNCVDQCDDYYCIDCYSGDELVRAKAIWEKRFKPHIEYLMGTPNGYSAAIILACQCCEHAYKTIKKLEGHNLMQDSLEAVLRLHDFSLAQEYGETLKPCEKPHWCRQYAWDARESLNTLKHEGMTKAYFEREGIKYEIKLRGPEMLGISLELISRTNVVKSRSIQLGSRYIVNSIIKGIDKAYMLFTDEESSDEEKCWFSPAPCQCDYGKCPSPVGEGVSAEDREEGGCVQS